MKLVRYALWTVVAIAVVANMALFLGWRQSTGTPTVETLGVPPDRPRFELVDHNSRSVSQSNFNDKPKLIFFGFTYCPEICPTTLVELGSILESLGADGDKLDVLFITVDPERDTPEQIALYLQSFDKRVTGLSGSPAATNAALKAFRQTARKVETTTSYTMDHPTSTFLFDREWRFKGTLDYHEEKGAQLAKVKRLLRES